MDFFLSVKFASSLLALLAGGLFDFSLLYSELGDQQIAPPT